MKSKWIRVKEDLPEPNILVNILIKREYGYEVFIGRREGEEWYSIDCYFNIKNVTTTIVAWVPFCNCRLKRPDWMRSRQHEENH